MGFSYLVVHVLILPYSSLLLTQVGYVTTICFVCFLVRCIMVSPILLFRFRLLFACFVFSPTCEMIYFGLCSRLLVILTLKILISSFGKLFIGHEDNSVFILRVM